jgi:S-adenosylmethionine-diacylglycerol 3-amino-3-carboxypropyl transferase
MKLKKSLNKLRDKIFHKIHTGNLVYNTCWEDPRIDRELMRLDADSQVVMITSAGCNALDYLLDNPQAVHAIDMNPRQNALLELKKAFFRNTDHETLFRFFGNGYAQDAQEVYASRLRNQIPFFAQDFWDKRINFFTKKKKKSFYYCGTSGSFAWLFTKYLKSHGKLYPTILQLLEAQSLTEQEQYYAFIEPRLINKFTIWTMNRHVTLSLLGVPRQQRQLILDEYRGGIAEYIADNFRRVFTAIPIHDNYFWRVYLTGHYTPQCCPNYLLEQNFQPLKEREGRLKTYTTTISQFLKDNPGKYTHFVLLDHQDWMSHYAPDLLKEEWELILQNSAPNAKILLRSASPKVSFLPEFVKERLELETVNTARLHPLDRVGTYGSVLFATILPEKTKAVSKKVSQPLQPKAE